LASPQLIGSIEKTISEHSDKAAAAADVVDIQGRLALVQTGLRAKQTIGSIETTCVLRAGERTVD
jgi:hypothetical protein